MGGASTCGMHRRPGRGGEGFRRRGASQSALLLPLQAALNSALKPTPQPREVFASPPVEGCPAESARGGRSTAGRAPERLPHGTRLVTDARQEQARRAAAHTPDILNPILVAKAVRKVKDALGADDLRAGKVVEVAEALEISCMQEPGLLWIAEQGVDAPMPEGWAMASAGKLPVYVHGESGTVINEHPLFPQLRKLAAKMRAEAYAAMKQGKHAAGGEGNRWLNIVVRPPPPPPTIETS